MAKEKRQSRRLQRPHSGLMTPRQETPSNIYKWFTLPETRAIAYIFAAGSVGLSLLLFTQLSLEFEPS